MFFFGGYTRQRHWRRPSTKHFMVAFPSVWWAKESQFRQIDVEGQGLITLKQIELATSLNLGMIFASFLKCPKTWRVLFVDWAEWMATWMCTSFEALNLDCEVLKKYDVSEDGFIDHHEFVAFWPHQIPEKPRRHEDPTCPEPRQWCAQISFVRQKWVDLTRRHSGWRVNQLNHCSCVQHVGAWEFAHELCATSSCWFGSAESTICGRGGLDCNSIQWDFKPPLLLLHLVIRTVRWKKRLRCQHRCGQSGAPFFCGCWPAL